MTKQEAWQEVKDVFNKFAAIELHYLTTQEMRDISRLLSDIDEWIYEQRIRL